MRLIEQLISLVPNKGSVKPTLPQAKDLHLFVCYGKIAPKSVKGYKLVILESEHYNKNDIKVFKKNNEKVIAYVSLTEVNKSASIYKEVEKYTLGKNVNWDSYFLDLGNYETKIALYHFASKTYKKGFDGLFLDNLDNVSQWGNLKKQRNVLVSMVKEIRARHKSMLLVQNAGLFLAKDLKDQTDAILVESVFSNYNLKDNKSRLRNNSEKKQILGQIENAIKIKEKPVYLLEYTSNAKMKIKLKKELESFKLPHFIANIDLQSKPKFN